MVSSAGVLVLLVACLATSPSSGKVTFFRQHVDHMNQMSHSQETFDHKIIENRKWWGGNGYPIFFYAGGDGPIEQFYEEAGYVHLLAKEFKAMEVFAEHRFYGESLPLGKSSFNNPNVGLLSMDQALADFAFIGYRFLEYEAGDSKIVVFGSGYSGLLSFYLRLKYPDVFIGSIASSAPVYLEDPVRKRDFFFPAVSEIFQKHDERCHGAVVQAYKDVQKREHLKDDLRLCQDVQTQEDFTQLLFWTRDLFVKAAVHNHAEASKFPYMLPANPVKAVCKQMLSDLRPIVALGKALGVLYNATGDKQCFSPREEFTVCSDANGCGTGDHVNPWFYQNCIENRSPKGSDNTTSMFPNLPNGWREREGRCMKKFGIVPIDNWTFVEYCGARIGTAQNVVFYNGDQDPWLKAGVTTKQKDFSFSIIPIVAKGGRHGEDLRAPSPNDPSSVLQARTTELENIKKWLRR